jgi:hypothetical protein
MSESVIAYNNGDGSFTIKNLPTEVQFSSVNAIEVLDIDQDGKDDIILGGNEYAYKPQYARLDASFGHVLMAKDSETYEVLPSQESGFFVRGEIKAIKTLKIGKHTYVLAAVNNESPKLFKLQ